MVASTLGRAGQQPDQQPDRLWAFCLLSHQKLLALNSDPTVDAVQSEGVGLARSFQWLRRQNDSFQGPRHDSLTLHQVLACGCNAR